jgi:YegS/Rv2252/BmrU family lipid kinase
VVRQPPDAAPHGALTVATRVRVAVVINPVAGVRGGTLERARRRAEQAFELLAARGAEPEVLITERAGHARELTAGAVERGARLVIAWGGDGTVNEVASALAFSPAALGIIPAGSGNGLARMCHMPADVSVAIPRMLDAGDRLIDVGDANGRLFVNVAGIGFDAHVAGCFARLGRQRRGFLRYASIVLSELGRYRAQSYTVTAAAETLACDDAFLLTFANGRQWGNGAVIAPYAELDDGELDLRARSAFGILRAIPRLFHGTVDRVPGVEMHRVRAAQVACSEPLTLHVDGEAVGPLEQLTVGIHPRALRFRA